MTDKLGAITLCRPCGPSLLRVSGKAGCRYRKRRELMREPTYEMAVEIVRRENATEHTTMRVHKLLRCGYNQAARYVERMQREGIVSEPNTVGVRVILTGAK